MKLGVKDRLLLLALLPGKGNLLTLKLVKDLQDRLSFSGDELTEFELQNTEQKTVIWNEDKEKSIEVDFGVKEMELVRAELKKLDSSNNLTLDHLPLYERFMGEGK